MTSQKDQIQSLINEIERALSAGRSNKLWVRSSDVAPQREVLTKAQDYLVSLQQTFDAPDGWGPVDPSTGQIAETEAGDRSGRTPVLPTLGSFEESDRLGETADLSEGGGSVSQTAENVLQALLTEMKYLKSSALEPLRLEMDELRAKRDRLQAEVRSLDEARESASSLSAGSSPISESQLNEFLSALMARLQENLTVQVGQTLEQLESDHAAAISKLAADDEAVLQLRSSGQIEELRQLQGRSDQLLVNIDSTLQRMFETLQQNINSYQRSLNEGLDNMHSLGRQGEVIVRSLVDHLTAQLGQSAPSEPAFFSPRSAAVPLVLADEESPLSRADEIVEDDAASDTVSSLNEILPDLSAEATDTESDRELEQTIAPEDCIREDGSIDLDLLKLDIDRDEGDAIAPEDVMVDAAVADAQVAATESGDAEIEAKVLPTAESLYLADLTLDDLTVDPDLSSTDDADEPDSTLSASEEADEEADSSSAFDSASSSALTSEDEELAAVLPDLSLPLDTSDSIADGDSDALAEESNSDAEEALSDAPVESEQTEAAQDIESALVPDIPDADDDLIDNMPLPGEGSDALSADLAAELAGVSQEAERAAAEAVEGDLELLASDLEEAIVFEAEAPEPTQLSETSEPLDSAQIPEPPESDEVEGSLQSSLEAVDSTATAETTASEAALPLTDFDDDLDFYLEPETASETNSEQTAREIESDLPAVPPLLESPLNASSAAPLAEPIDPFVTADLERSFETPEAIAADPPTVSEDSADEKHWFLGVDIGTTGLSAVLINRTASQVYPLCWTAGDDANRFRLPAVAHMIGRERSQPGFSEQIGEVGTAALATDDNRLLRHIKPLLKIGIPHGDTGEPWVQWSEQVALPLQQIQSALSELLKSLSAQRTSCHAVGLQDEALRRALANLSGVAIGYPTNWPDTYSFNVREAVLAAGLISQAEQVYFVEESIATLLSALPDPGMDPAEIDDQQPGLYNCLWSGGTVVLSAGATLTEAAIANLPQDLEQLSYRDFATRSFGYAGDSLDQDIICQLLHAPAQQAADEPSDASSGWQSLGLDNLALPQPGEADRAKRYRLRQRLNSSALGRGAIAIAQRLKVDLQEVDRAEVSLGDRTWIVKRKDLETKVFLPYIQRVNRQVNALLGQSEVSADSVRQVICTGGSASLSAISRWLRQKFPNATIIQDTYSGEYSNSCSRVAYGLANLCHYPQVLDGNRHRYSDYFLLLELLRVLPDQPLPAGGILHLLEQRGIDVRACQLHILALIEGHLPPGLVPIDSDRPLISAQSPDIPAYQDISELPLFRKQGGQIYIADAEQGERLRQYLEGVLSSKAQTLDEPQALTLATETARD